MNLLTNKKFLFSILLYLVFKLFFSIYYPIELDEAFSYFWSRNDWNTLINLIRTDIHPPLTYLIHKFLDINKSEFGVRWFYYLISIFSILFLKKLSEEVLDASERKYFWIIVLFSSFLILRTTVARMHAFTFFLSVSCSYFFIKFLKSSDKTVFLKFFLFSLLFSLNFYPSISFVFFLYTFLIYNYRREVFVRIIIYAFVFFLIFTLIILKLFYPGGTQFQVIFNLPTGFIIPYVIFSYLYNEEIINWNLLKSYDYLIFVFFILIFPTIFFIWNGFKKLKEEKNLIFYLTANLLSFLSIFVLSIFIPKLLYSPKYVIHIYPLFLIILAKGLVCSNKLLKKVFLLIYVLINIYSIYLMLFKTKEDWRWVSDVISKNRNNNDYIFVEYLDPFCFYYNCDYKTFEIKDFNLFEKDYDNFWLVYSPTLRKKFSPDFLNKFKIKFYVRKEYIRIMYLEKK